MHIYTVTLNPALDRELAVPEIRFDVVMRATEEHIDYGGKGFNVSRALAALGKKSEALGFLGGVTGQRIARGLNDLGILVHAINIGEETRTNVSIATEAPGPYLKVNMPGPHITRAEQDALLEKVAALARPKDWWVLSGSLPQGVPDTLYADIIRCVQKQGARALLDASGPALKAGGEASPFLVKPNAQEAAELTGMSLAHPADARNAILAIHTMGIRIVMITFAEAGAVLSDGNEIWLSQPPEITERNPTGAGDATVAGLLWAISESFPWREALRWGVAAGTAAASLSGTGVGNYDSISTYAEKVKVMRLLGT